MKWLRMSMSWAYQFLRDPPLCLALSSIRMLKFSKAAAKFYLADVNYMLIDRSHRIGIDLSFLQL